MAQNHADEVVGKYNSSMKKDWDKIIVIDDDKAEIFNGNNQLAAKLRNLFIIENVYSLF